MFLASIKFGFGSSFDIIISINYFQGSNLSCFASVIDGLPRNNEMTKSTIVVFQIVLVLFASALVPCYGDLRIPNFVASKMVLQREPHQARLWGWAALEANITVKLDGQDNVLGFGIAHGDTGKWCR